MYCKNCGQQVNDNVNSCPYCGTQTGQCGQGKVDNPSHLAGIASCCFPVVGLILYFIWKDEKPKSAKLVCYWMIGGIVAWVVFYLLALVLGVIGSMGYGEDFVLHVLMS